MKNNLLLLASLFLFIACNEDDEETICPPNFGIESNAYFPMEVGNYWVYEFQTYFLDGSTSGNTSIDSLIVVGDTLIDNQQYFIFTTNKPSPGVTWFLKDSAGTVLSRGGSMVLPPNPRQDFYNEHYGTAEGDTVYHYYDQFPSLDVVSTNFGSEECLLQEATHIAYPPFGNDPVVDTSYYASFGPVQRSYAYLSGAKMVGVLTDYHLE